MSRGTSEAFFDVVEWASEQSWSSGKVGLLGISYYAGSQWRVAARQPKGLAAMIPWEGMSDYYRDRCRHGGILSNAFIRFWVSDYSRDVYSSLLCSLPANFCVVNIVGPSGCLQSIRQSISRGEELGSRHSRGQPQRRRAQVESSGPKPGQRS